jgi:hypothetical protein
MSRKEKVEEFLSNHKGIMAAIGLLIAALGLARYFLDKFVRPAYPGFRRAQSGLRTAHPAALQNPAALRISRL